MVTEALSSPNAIPVRTSSTGITNGHSLPTKPVLKPVPEGTWLSSSNTKLHTTASLSHIRHKSDPVPPKRTSSKRASRNMGLSNGSTWSSEKEKIILGPYDYMADRPGKDIRTQLIAAFNSWLKIPDESLTVITKITGMLHTASLLVDDVEDSSELRRGIPVAHNIFGTAQTINSANYVYFLALQEISKLGNPRAIDVFVKEMVNLHRGQGMDLFWRDTLTCPSEDDYLEMVGNKTGGLFRLAIKLMQAESTTGKDYVPLVNVMGTLFQICDDYLNLSSTTYTKNKGLCEDLTEGKFSFPIIHSVRSNPQNLQLINILKQKTKNEEVKRYAVAYMESTGSFEYCRKVIKELKAKAVGMIDMLDDGDGEAAEVRRVLDKMDLA